jgi:hypothetical protein
VILSSNDSEDCKSQLGPIPKKFDFYTKGNNPQNSTPDPELQNYCVFQRDNSQGGASTQILIPKTSNNCPNINSFFNGYELYFEKTDQSRND